ncbi:MAG: PASTA domain-containing protein [Oscillospiraceae bacterium]|nr:PASTA domain-containing protein [Oscillospiraceae bacterium]
MMKKDGKVIDVTPKGHGRFKKTLVNLLVTLAVGLVLFYFELPAINLQNQGFYFFFFILSGVYCAVAIVTSGIWKLKGQDDFFPSVKNHCKIPLTVCALFLLLIIFGTILSSEVLRSRAYRDLLTVEQGDFNQDVDEITFDQIPLLDRDSAEKLGDRKLGELSDMVSQFEVADDYTQINFNDRPVRVTPLVYGDLIKWINNRHNGIPAYIRIDMITQNVEVVRLAEGMKYTKDEHFGRNLYRHLRFNYPTFIFDEPTFEIDEDGNPYWVCPRVVKRIGLFGGKDIDGAVLVNAVTGECEYYKEVPQWVDRVYSAELIIQQYDYYGLYTKGFINSIFGQKNVTVTTDGYNYIALNDDVYVYTGVTSVGGDQSNVGFILSNERTKETKYYTIAGAEEYSAMSSAEGVVQQYSYVSTFPLLLNIKGEPTYFMALKDNAGLVKMYAMVNVRQYQIVATGATVQETEKNYETMLAQNNLLTQEEAGTAKTDVTGAITELRSAVVDGNSIYYVKLDSSDSYFSVSASVSEQIIIASVGDTAKISYVGDGSGAIIDAAAFEIVGFAPKQAAKVTIPDVAGMTPDAATAMLEDLGLQVAADQQTAKSDTVKTGAVAGTDPAAGTEVDAGSSVTLVIASD